MKTAIAAFFGRSDIILGFEYRYIVLSCQHVCDGINILNIGTDYPNTGNIRNFPQCRFIS